MASPNLIETWTGRRANNLAGGDLIPTWQQGVEQPLPNDLKRFAEEGYSKNSLIYSCVRERATAFASLGSPQIVRADGSVLSGPSVANRVTELIADPNPTQDGADFAELLQTHYSVHGNAYIHKVRVSSDPDFRARRRGWPVQELSLIRPDYVTIEPGATPSADVFVVKIEGVERLRIPRRDMIHIHEPNLINDFYGLSKIALLVREGSLDLEMLDFSLAFYRNAGVPMGILSVAGRYTREQTSQIQSDFRRALSGFTRWFRVLVLNKDEATYTPLGAKQSEMESETTRALIESRICMVFGVPPILVGAKFAILAGGQNGDYEAQQFGYWSETMVPEANRIARAFTKHLLPEFAGTRDRGAIVRYDYTNVRVLQEDLSRKLREVVRMINTGAIMVSTAFRTVGMEPPPNSDFYLRSGNQAAIDADGKVIVAAQPAGGSGESDADNPLEGAALEESAAVREAERLTIFEQRNGWH